MGLSVGGVLRMVLRPVRPEVWLNGDDGLEDGREGGEVLWL